MDELCFFRAENKIFKLLIILFMLVGCTTSNPTSQQMKDTPSLANTETPTQTDIAVVGTPIYLETPSLTAIAKPSLVGEVFPYEPMVVQLTGLIQQQTFAGPPEWESVERGDQALTYWILHLNAAINVGDDRFDFINEPEKNVLEIQLVLNQQQHKRYETYLEQPVQVSGTLFHQTTGYHFKKILMDVENIELLE